MSVESKLQGIDRQIEKLLVERGRIVEEERMRIIQDYIVRHLRKTFTVEDLAAHLGVSLRTLDGWFQGSFGMRPKQFILQMRLQAARERFANPLPDDSVGGIAREFQFLTNESRFAQAYRKEFRGQYPSEALEKGMRRRRRS
jgi:transcriptional regulator GlxA family with amidase domain